MVPSRDFLTYNQLNKLRIQSFKSFLFPRSPAVPLCRNWGLESLTHSLCFKSQHIRLEKPEDCLLRVCKSRGAKALDLELKHVRLFLGELGHLLPDGLHQGRCGDVGQGCVRRVVLCQALLGGRRGGHWGMLQAGVHGGWLAVLAREPGGRVLLIPRPGISLDVPWEGHLQRTLGEQRGA